jgi:RNA polymerase sigma factor (sigma-70 family)
VTDRKMQSRVIRLSALASTGGFQVERTSMEPSEDLHALADEQLLRRFTAGRCDDSFAALVARHVDLVYSAARRQVRDAAQAEEVTQSVFIVLARKASSVRRGEALAGWLLTVTRYTAKDHQRIEQRRRRREREAAMNHRETTAVDQPAWGPIEALLDEAMSKLGREDRDALAMKYFQGRKIGEIAAVLNISEAAAQKRVHRAVEKLRAWFARRGVSSPSSADLGALLAANATRPAPTALTAKAAAGAGTGGTSAGGAGAGAQASSGAWKALVMHMAWTKTQLAIASIAGAALVATVGVTAVKLFSTPSRSRMVQVGPPPPTPAETAASLAQFNAIYQLKPGENIKRVMPPWVPGRLVFYQTRVDRGQVDAIPQGPDSFILRQAADGELSDRSLLFGPPDVSRVVESVVGLIGSDVDLPEDLANKPLPGDWVVRDGATREQKAAEVAKAIRAAAGQAMQLQSRTAEREVIVVRGHFAFHEIADSSTTHSVTAASGGGNGRRKKVFVFRGKLDPHQRPGEWGGSGGLPYALKMIGSFLDMPVIIETSSDAPIEYRIKASAHVTKEHKLSPDQIDEVLANLAKQTSLEFHREQRVLPVWELTPVK